MSEKQSYYAAYSYQSSHQNYDGQTVEEEKYYFDKNGNKDNYRRKVIRDKNKPPTVEESGNPQLPGRLSSSRKYILY